MNTPRFHLPLVDVDPSLSGSQQFVPDEWFGTCLELTGTAGPQVLLGAPMTAYTLELWVNVSRPFDEAALLTIPGYGMLSVTADGTLRYSVQVDGELVVGLTAGLGIGDWQNITVAYGAVLNTSGQRYVALYLDGQEVGSCPVPAGAAPLAGTLICGFDPSGGVNAAFGRLAHLRVYPEAIDQTQIRRDMSLDRSTLAAFTSTHPVTIELVNSDGQFVLYTDAGLLDQAMILRITNISLRDIDLRSTTGSAGADTYHLALRWRAGTLAPSCLPKVSTAGWSTFFALDQTVYLLHDGPLTLPANGVTEVTLTGLRADGADGPRGTRIEFDYRNLGYSGTDDEISGYRHQALEILGHGARRYPPLELVPTDAGRVYNTGARSDGGVVWGDESSIEVRLRNVSHDVTVPLLGQHRSSGDPESNSTVSCLTLSIEAHPQDQDPGTALVPASVADRVTLMAVDSDWTVTRDPIGANLSETGGTVRWRIMPKYNTAVAPGGLVRLRLDHVIGQARAGYAPITVEYHDLLGYQDGVITTHAELTPIGLGAGRISVGVPPAGEQPAPLAPLHAMGPISGPVTNNPDSATVLIGTRTSGLMMGVKHESAERYAWMQPLREAPLVLNPLGNKVGIGTASPTSRLTVSADGAHLQLRREASDAGAGRKVFLELFSAQRADNQPVYPSIRFTQAGETATGGFSHRIEASADGLMFRTGDIKKDDLVNLYAGTAVLENLRMGTTTITADDLARLKALIP